ncbi:CRISPR-associated protein Cas4 [Lachnospiraceae bacterium NSJ-143]|nr:CRISPR-associated protein Cas4 [Lachnospiraceae bacterium NSJ-143]
MNEITIRSIQHFLYCAHRWGLIEIGNAWSENFFVTKANIIHENVHESNSVYTKRGAKVFTAVPVFYDKYNLYGVVDCIEGSPSKNGVHIAGNDERYDLCIVEYKPAKPKDKDYRYEDLMQVFAQKICVDSIFGCDCKGVLYYADVKKRVELPLSEDYNKYDRDLRNILVEMQNYLEKGVIPPVKRGQYCSGCSMKDICMPSVKSFKSVREQIEGISEGEQ